MSIFEYDQEKHMQHEREEHFQKGMKKGVSAGEAKLAGLITLLQQAGRTEDILRVVQDAEIREQLYREYHIE